MSMPTIPNIDLDIDIERKDVINLLLASIAFEELGLAHIINAEAEKIQFVLGTLEESGEYFKNNPQDKPDKPDLDDLLAINKSVERVLKKVILKEVILGFKLEDIIELSEKEDDGDEHK